MNEVAETHLHIASGKSNFVIWLQWVLATTAGAAASGGGILTYFRFYGQFSSLLLATIGFLFLGAFIGIVLSTIQWLTLRKRVPHAKRWIVGSALGATMGQFLNLPIILVLDFLDEIEVIGLFMMGASVGLGLGFGQWATIRRYGCRTGWWVPISGLSWA